MSKEMHFQKMIVESIYQNKKCSDEFYDLMIPIGNLTPEKVIEVYQEDYQYRMLEALQSSFETVWMLMGDDAFCELVFTYIKSNPSTHKDLNQYGASFPSYLKNIDELLYEVGKFELSYWKIFHQTSDEIQHSIKEDQFVNYYLDFSEQEKLLKFNCDVLAIFDERKNDSDSFREKFTEKEIQKETYFVLYKKNKKVLHHKLSAKQFELVEKLINGKTIGEVLEDIKIDPAEVQQLFAFLTKDLKRTFKEKK